MSLAVLVLRSLFMSVEKSSMAIHIAESRFYSILLHYPNSVYCYCASKRGNNNNKNYYYY